MALIYGLEKHRGKSTLDSGAKDARTGHTSVQVIQAGTMSVTWGGEYGEDK